MQQHIDLATQEHVDALILDLRAGLSKENQKVRVRRLAELLDYGDKDQYYNYEVLVTQVVREVPDISDLLREILGSVEEDERTRFLCFAILFSRYRRRRERTKAQRLVEDIAKAFNHIPLFSHFVAMSFEGGSLPELREGLLAAKAAASRLPDHAGALHTYAVYVADLAHVDGLIDAKELAAAVDSVNRAIALYSEHARFFHTRARLHRLRGDYEEAYADVVKAIDMEATVYPDRIPVYLIERATIEAEQSMSRLTHQATRSLDQVHGEVAAIRREFDDQIDRINNAQTRVIEAVAFIAAALALVQTTIQVVNNARTIPEVLITLSALALILFGAVGLGAWVLRRGARRTGR